MSALAIRDEKQYLSTIDEVRALAQQITDVGEARELGARARAAEVWARRAHLGAEKVNLTIVARAWAERRAGELLRELRGDAKRLPNRTLAECKVSETESSRWQKLVDIPEDEFEATCTALLDLSKTENGQKRAGRSGRDKAKRKTREKAEAEAREVIAEVGPDAHRVVVADVHTWHPTGVACIITDPPYITDDAVELHSALADFALDVLPPHGALVVMTWQPLLPDVFAAMKRDRLTYRWTAAWTYATSERTPERAQRVFDGWKPVLVFHKDGWTDETTYLYDVVVSPDTDKGSHEWGQNIDGFRHLVRAFSQPGETVCDPFVGGGTTAVAALAEARLFIGCDKSPEAKEITDRRLAA